MSNEEPGGFLARWSRLKNESRKPPPAAQPLPTASEPGTHKHPAPVEDDGETRDEAETSVKRMLTEQDFADVDFAALNPTSDYTRFMANNVPDAIRKRALQQLWLTDPVLSAVDPMQDYAGDYTDKAVAVADGLVNSAYKVGRGFLSDEEVAAWDALGPQKPRPVVVEQTPTVIAAAAADAWTRVVVGPA